MLPTGDEVHFRDTANGFLAWAVALVITVAFLTTAAFAMAGRIEASDTANRSGGPAAGLAADPNAYFVDRLFRSDHMVTTEGDAVARAEAAKFFSHYAWRSEVPPSDTAYLAELVAARTGLSASDASKRVADVIADARQSEDNTRVATAHFL